MFRNTRLGAVANREPYWLCPMSSAMTHIVSVIVLLCCCCSVGHLVAAQWTDDSAAFSGTDGPDPMPPLMSITSTSFDIVHTPANVTVAQRRGKFFFDALFGLGTAVVNSGTGSLTADDEDDEDEDDETDTTKRCDCRECFFVCACDDFEPISV